MLSENFYLEQVLRYQDIEELFKISSVNKYFKTLCKDELHRRYPKLKEKTQDEIYDLFKQLKNQSKDIEIINNVIDSKFHKVELLDNNLYINDSLQELDEQLFNLYNSVKQIFNIIK